MHLGLPLLDFSRPLKLQPPERWLDVRRIVDPDDILVRIFALLDRRLGRCRLLALEGSMEQELDWVRAFYVIRMQAEGLMEKE